MKKKLADERVKRGYSIDDRFDPIRDKNTLGRVVVSIGIVTIIVIAVIILISIVALQNAGQPIEISFS
jgi:hypothetical protein